MTNLAQAHHGCFVTELQSVRLFFIFYPGAKEIPWEPPNLRQFQCAGRWFSPEPPSHDICLRRFGHLALPCSGWAIHQLHVEI